MTPHELLKRYFGYEAFRGRQQEVIEHVLRGRHALLIMPTGMGKSLCYQIPALYWAQSQDVSDRSALRPLTLVLSPLIALMKDQVDGLRARGIDATFINSSLNRTQRETRYAALARGEHTLLYVTPERFRKPAFREVLAARTVSLLAVDEAHCISQWGHDFRPDYSRVAEFRQLLGNPPTLALTATATPDVQQDIVAQLGLRPDQIRLFHEGIDRPNLSLTVEEAWDDDDKLQRIARLMEQYPGSTIVYFTLIKTLQRFSDRFHSEGWRHLIYHGDLPRDERREVQEAFMSCPGQVVLATNAFGMGVDKEDIRLVIHADVPGSMEAYYQEIGRAGRDGHPAACVLLYDQRDLATQMEFLRWSNPDAEFYERVYDYLRHEQEALEAFGLDWLREKLHAKQKADHRLETCLSMLERFGVIDLNWNPLRIKLLGDLPSELSDPHRLADKLRRDQEKLYALVRYASHEGDRKAFIHEYFGIPPVAP